MQNSFLKIEMVSFTSNCESKLLLTKSRRMIWLFVRSFNLVFLYMNGKRGQQERRVGYAIQCHGESQIVTLQPYRTPEPAFAPT